MVDSLDKVQYNKHLATKECDMRNLTLEQALQFNKGINKVNRQSTLQVKNWYRRNYYMKANGRWCCMIGYMKESRKYSTC